MASATQPTKNATRARLRPTAAAGILANADLGEQAAASIKPRAGPADPASSLNSPQPPRSIPKQPQVPLHEPRRTEDAAEAIGIREQIQKNPVAKEVLSGVPDDRSSLRSPGGTGR